MKSSHIRRIAGSLGFFAPTLLMVVDQSIALFSSGRQLPGSLVYVSIIVAAAVCVIWVFSSRIAWWQKSLVVVGLWFLIVVQVLLIGLWALMTGGLEGVQ